MTAISAIGPRPLGTTRILIMELGVVEPVSTTDLNSMAAIGWETAPPALNNVAGTVSLFGTGAATLSPALSVANPTSSTLVGATITIIGGGLADDGDVLSANTAGTGITASFNSATETLTLSGSDTLAAYQAVLRSVTFSSATGNDLGLDPTRTLSWVLNNGDASDGMSATSTTTLDILNSPPPADTSAALIMRRATDGSFVVYDIGENQVLTAAGLGAVGTIGKWPASAASTAVTPAA